uniref:Uncharacterized protein n=1 Tax=Anguilla anguilla TaxID=7936 RepID=A0A0E9UIU1_ANGAN
MRSTAVREHEFWKVLRRCSRNSQRAVGIQTIFDQKNMNLKVVI